LWLTHIPKDFSSHKNTGAGNDEQAFQKYWALWRECWALLRGYWALLRVGRAFVRLCRALVRVNRALLEVYRTLLKVYRALLIRELLRYSPHRSYGKEPCLDVALLRLYGLFSERLLEALLTVYIELLLEYI